MMKSIYTKDSEILENPIWHALNSGNQALSSGNGAVQYFPDEVTSFVGLEHFSKEEFQTLYEMMPPNSVRATFIPDDRKAPPPWEMAGGLDIYQLVYDKPDISDTFDLDCFDSLIVPLKDDNIQEMVALTKLTNPGPFKERTIDFGEYYGVFENGRLAAMAGQRLKPGKYIEISAVCTHPDFRGKGYARKLLQFQMQLILKRHAIPFLHVKTDNVSAIKLYESLGFNIKRTLSVIIFRKN